MEGCISAHLPGTLPSLLLCTPAHCPPPTPHRSNWPNLEPLPLAVASAEPVTSVPRCWRWPFAFLSSGRAGGGPGPESLPRLAAQHLAWQVSSAGTSSLPGEVGHREDDQSPPPLSLPSTFLPSPHPGQPCPRLPYPFPGAVGVSAGSQVGVAAGSGICVGLTPGEVWGGTSSKAAQPGPGHRPGHSTLSPLGGHFRVLVPLEGWRCRRWREMNH